MQADGASAARKVSPIYAKLECLKNEKRKIIFLEIYIIFDGTEYHANSANVINNGIWLIGQASIDGIDL